MRLRNVYQEKKNQKSSNDYDFEKEQSSDSEDDCTVSLASFLNKEERFLDNKEEGGSLFLRFSLASMHGVTLEHFVGII